MKEGTSYKDLAKRAKDAESKENFEEAIKLYQEAMKTEPSDELPYNRLMIIFRKQKNYKEELKVINEGISFFFQEQHENKQKNLIASNKKIIQLRMKFKDGFKIPLHHHVHEQVTQVIWGQMR